MNVETLTLVNVAIVLFALFFFISTLSSHMLEVLVGFLNCRGRLLRNQLGKALTKEAAEEIYENPLIKSLAGDGIGKPLHLPSYIEPELFARAGAALA